MSSVPILRDHTLLDFGSYRAPAYIVADPLQCPAGVHEALSAVRHFFDVWVWPAVRHRFRAERQHRIFRRWLARPELVAIDNWQTETWVQLADRDAALP